MDAVHPPQRADAVRGPGFSLTGGHSHPVQRRGDVLVRPSRGHAPHDGEGLFGVRQPCSPDFGLRTRSCRCWPPRQWIVRTTSRAVSSTSAMMSVTRARRSRCRARMLTPGAFHAASRSSASPAKSGAGQPGQASAPPIAPGTPRRDGAPPPSSSRAVRRWAIVWIAGSVTPLRERGFIPGLLQLEFDDPLLFTSTFHVSPFGLHRRLDRQRLDGAGSSRAIAASIRRPPNVKHRGSPSIWLGRSHR